MKYDYKIKTKLKVYERYAHHFYHFALKNFNKVATRRNNVGEILDFYAQGYF